MKKRKSSGTWHTRQIYHKNIKIATNQIIGHIEDVAYGIHKEGEVQLSFDFGPAPHVAVMLDGGGYYSPVDDKSIEAVNLVLVRPSSYEIPTKDTDGDYDEDDFDVVYRFTITDIWEASREHPEMSLKDFVELKAMQAQMGLTEDK